MLWILEDVSLGDCMGKLETEKAKEFFEANIQHGLSDEKNKVILFHWFWKSNNFGASHT